MTATVRIYLALGEPASTRTAEISNWTGKAVAGPRSQLDQVLAREESSKPGVCFLTGVNPETGKDRVYIGEAELIKSRIKGHLDREFGKTIVYFVSKDENLTKAHIKYLEGKLIDIAGNRGALRLRIPMPVEQDCPNPMRQTWMCFWLELGSCYQFWAKIFCAPKPPISQNPKIQSYFSAISRGCERQAA